MCFLTKKNKDVILPVCVSMLSLTFTSNKAGFISKGFPCVRKQGGFPIQRAELDRSPLAAHINDKQKSNPDMQLIVGTIHSHFGLWFEKRDWHNFRTLRVLQSSVPYHLG